MSLQLPSCKRSRWRAMAQRAPTPCPRRCSTVSQGRARQMIPFAELVRGLPMIPAGGSGDATLTKICYDFTKQVFTPAREDFQVLLHGGNTVGWAIVMQTLCEPGEYVLVEQFVYPSAQAFFIPMGCKAAPVQIDGDGMIPESLDEIMTNWNRDHPGVKKPHV